jgi:uncharacterized protein
VITLDTSALLALLNRRDPDHQRTVSACFGDPGPYLIPVGILAEIAYLVERRLGQKVLEAFLEDLDEGAFSLDCGEKDLARIRNLVHRYADLPLGFADASVIACAERNGGKALTLDLRHFGAVARELPLVLLPDQDR